MSSAIWNAIPSSRPYSPPRRATEQARRLEELAGLERAALEVGVDRSSRVVTLPPLQRLAARERQGRVREDRDAFEVARLRQLGEGAREEVVAGRASGVASPCVVQAAALTAAQRAPSIRSS